MSIPQARTGSMEESERSLRLLKRKENKISETYRSTPEKKKKKEIQLDSKKANKVTRIQSSYFSPK